jgi:hypothetical protein
MKMGNPCQDLQLYEEIKRLPKDDAYANIKDNSLRILLSHAAEYQKHNAVQHLLYWHSDVDSKDKSGRTSLSRAAEADCPALVKLLLDNGADVNAKDSNGRTALFWAARAGSPKCVDELLLSGASRAIRDHLGLSALLLAERESVKHIEAIRAHLKEDPFLFYWGKTPFWKLTQLEKKIFDDEWQMKRGWDWLYIADGTPLFFNSEGKEISAIELASYRFALYGNHGPWSHFKSCFFAAIA